ncbi:hypothetical protein CH253_18715 [Rhodococcus sp. 06-156-3C]|nr:hypothetical protein CH248_27915 [Rhodococcus sp. 06-156-4a]OZD17962.1 hypothetical protein CH253_18715 [Rhodococcus sp. 06-156-3C]OZD20686.1 hypothetical protein CH280_03870 [Rhodococcus sp. 06-156-4C]OZD30595.1 hypothetical protein CH247_14860 [Rhodococcus sp. 06-156-3b]OZD32632.1 hypothetical protein CH284_20400 [Rhodococcus sp. 06-156-3]OZF64957.1 hypothetical protein CH290_10185 [Rhodococcus sp. 06-156-4]
MNIELGYTVVVLGTGPIGVMGVAGAAFRGAVSIIAVGSRPKTVEPPKMHGANDIIDYKQADVAEQALGGFTADPHSPHGPIPRSWVESTPPRRSSRKPMPERSLLSTNGQSGY